MIRGLCKKTAFDVDLGFSTGMMRWYRYVFVGFTTTEIGWDDSQKVWTMRSSYDASAVVAITAGGENGYPLGIQQWNFQNDHCGDAGVKQADGTYNMSISIHSCVDGTFNCRDGTW